VLYNVSPEPY